MDSLNKTGLLQFIDINIAKGWVNTNTGAGWKAAARKILEDVPADADIRQLDVKSEVLRYANRHPGALSPDSLSQYEKRVTLAIDQFEKYKSDPTAYKPIGRGPSTPKTTRKDKPDTKTPPTRPALKLDHPDDSAPAKPISGMATESSLAMPFPLRSGFLAQVVIPRDLTKDEAGRLCAFIHSLALPTAPPILLEAKEIE